MIITYSIRYQKQVFFYLAFRGFTNVRWAIEFNILEVGLVCLFVYIVFCFAI